MANTKLILQALGLLLWAAGAVLAAPEEFVGPFSTWTNAKVTYGAVGDGTADDTAALQAGLNALAAETIAVLYLPAGTYKITSTLTLTDTVTARIIGEAPATTIIKWAGISSQAMVYLNGVAYSSIARLTFDGDNKTSKGGIDQSWDGTGGFFDTGNEYVDLIFKNMPAGIAGGTLGHGFAEVTIKRNTFVGMTYAAISIWNFNALDVWVWDSTFENCAVGVQNADGGAGSFRLYRNLFKGSTVTDIRIVNTGVFSFRDNVSIGSNRFFEAGSTGNPNPTVLQGNRIVDSLTTATIFVRNQGPVVMVDNLIRGKAGATGAQVDSTADTISIGNSYTTSSPLSTSGRLVTVEDSIVDRLTISAAEPTMPSVPANMGRTIHEVTAGASAATIQTAIGNAVATGNKAVVHLQRGTYNIGTTLTIPAGADIQVIGDGYGATLFQWTGSTTGPLWTITGPTKVALQDFYFRADGAVTGDGVVLSTIDQAGSQVNLERVLTRRGGTHHLVVNGLNQAKVNLYDWGSAYMTEGGIGLRVNGGQSRTAIYSGASSDNPLNYLVNNGGTVLVRDVWYESALFSGYGVFNGTGNATFDSCRMATVVGGVSPAIAISDWTGQLVFLGSKLEDRFELTGNGFHTQLLLAGMLGQTTPAIVDSTAPPATVQVVNTRRIITPGGSTDVSNSPLTPDTAALVAQLSLMRAERPGQLGTTPAGTSDILLRRVITEYARNGVTINGTPLGARRVAVY